jgi:glycosyltransferase involved in cell wall biosynthesis
MREGRAPAQTHANEDFDHSGLVELPWLAPAHKEAVQGETERRCIALVGPSGASLAVALGSVIQDMAGHGHEIYCFAPAIDANAARSFARIGVQTASLPAFRQGFSPFADPRSVYRLSGMLRELRPDIIAGYSPKGAALGAVAGRMARVDHIVTLLAELGRGFAEVPDSPSLPARAYHKSLLRLAFRLSHTAVFFNAENHKILARHKMLPDSLRQFPLNGSGVDLEQFPETPLPPLDRGVMFLFAGPLDRRLGVYDYCEAARLLRVKSGNYRCLLAGPEVRGPNGFPLTELKRYREFVQYLGPQADLRPYMARTHAFVMPAVGDAVPGPLMEAVAMGRPIITTTSRGCRGVVSGGTNGMLVPPNDPVALSSAMVRLLTRPDLIPSMARASRGLAEARFNSRRINEQLLSALGL